MDGCREEYFAKERGKIIILSINLLTFKASFTAFFPSLSRIKSYGYILFISSCGDSLETWLWKNKQKEKLNLIKTKILQNLITLGRL